jgi:hypothetical protein
MKGAWEAVDWIEEYLQISRHFKETTQQPHQMQS